MEQYQTLLKSVLNYITYRSRSEKEVREYLHRKNAIQESIEKIISYCKDYAFIDDEKFAQAWIASRSNRRLTSNKIIKLELINKGIDPTIIDRLLIQSSMEEMDDLARAKKLAEKRVGRYKNLPRAEIYAKLGGVLKRRGFNWDVIKKSIDECLDLSYNK